MTETLSTNVTRARRRNILAPLDAEDGSAMVFGTVTMFTLVCFIALVFNTGTMSARVIEMQSGADAAAYAGGLVVANNLNAIAEMNDAMAVVYYSMMRYNIDIITFGVLERLRRYPEFVQTYYPGYVAEAQANPSVAASADVNPEPFAVFGTSPESFKSDIYDRVKRNAETLIPAGRRWIEVLAEAERVLAKSTAKMAEEAVFDVAKANGAQFVSIFPELKPELFFGGRDSILVEDRFSTNNKFSENFVNRYQIRKPIGNYEQNPIKAPTDWYVPLQGRSKPGEGFFQVRICWNIHDLVHSSEKMLVTGLPSFIPGAPFHTAVPGEYQKFRFGSPNGHWHHKHTHTYIDYSSGFPVPQELEHFSGHGFDPTDPELNIASGDPSHFQSIHTEAVKPFPIPEMVTDPEFAHHAVVPCPTCRGEIYTPSPEYSSVHISERRINPQWANLEDSPDIAPKNLRELYPDNEGDGTVRDRQPLILTQAIKNFGINVAIQTQAHRPILGASYNTGFQGTFSPALFPVPGWGYIGTASARIGLLSEGRDSFREQRMNVKWDSEINETENLYMTDRDKDSRSSQTVYFSARLTPLTANSWGSQGSGGSADPIRGYEQLLTGNWRSSPDGGNNGGADKIGQKLLEQMRFDSSLRESLLH